MKALTIWQPWTSLKACGAKEFETRGWATSYRGPIAIHAAAMNPFKAIHAVEDDAVYEAKILPERGDFRYLPLGAVIATGEMVACYPIVSVGWTGSTETRIAWVDGNLNPHYPSAREILFGDWTSGRYAWEIVNVRMLAYPVPAKGKQGLWNWDERGLTA